MLLSELGHAQAAALTSFTVHLGYTMLPMQYVLTSPSSEPPPKQSQLETIFVPSLAQAAAFAPPRDTSPTAVAAMSL